MKKISGYLILTCVFGGIFSIVAMDIGLLYATYFFGGAIAFTGAVVLAVNLIID